MNRRPIRPPVVAGELSDDQTQALVNSVAGRVLQTLTADSAFIAARQDSGAEVYSFVFIDPANPNVAAPGYRFETMKSGAQKRAAAAMVPILQRALSELEALANGGCTACGVRESCRTSVILLAQCCERCTCEVPK